MSRTLQATFLGLLICAIGTASIAKAQLVSIDRPFIESHELDDALKTLDA